MSMLEVQNLSVRFGSAVIVDDVSFSVQDGDWLMLIGPNGAGKSTIVNAVSRGVPYTGTVFFEGKDVQKTPAHLLARGMGVLAQHHTVGYAFSVEEVVRLGRYAYAPGIFSRRSDEDERSVAEAMELTGVAHIARQSVLTLSGGELQRVFLAQLFAQNPRLLLLDEPTNHLDLVYQKQIFSLVREWLSRAAAPWCRSCTISRSRGCTEAAACCSTTVRSLPRGRPRTCSRRKRSTPFTAWMSPTGCAPCSPNGKSEESSKAPPEPRRRLLL